MNDDIVNYWEQVTYRKQIIENIQVKFLKLFEREIYWKQRHIAFSFWNLIIFDFVLFEKWRCQKFLLIKLKLWYKMFQNDEKRIHRESDCDDTNLLSRDYSRFQNRWLIVDQSMKNHHERNIQMFRCDLDHWSLINHKSINEQSSWIMFSNIRKVCKLVIVNC